MTISLNQGQQDAVDSFMDFLLSEEQEMIITGGGGFGKSFLVDHIVTSVLSNVAELRNLLGLDSIRYNYLITATTNKAAGVLSRAIRSNIPTTIHKALNLKVRRDFSTGKTSLFPSPRVSLAPNTILIVDECSLIDFDLHNHIRKALTTGCKVLYVGDHCQLPPINANQPYVFTLGLRTAKLTEPVRNSGSEGLVELTTQVRNSVETGDLIVDMPDSPDIIRITTKDELHKIIKKEIHRDYDGARILAYTNKKVIEYNQLVRTLSNDLSVWTVGDIAVVNSFNNPAYKAANIGVDDTVQIKGLGMTHTFMDAFDYVVATVANASGGFSYHVKVPLDWNAFDKYKRQLKKDKDFPSLFHLDDEFLDLRDFTASTVHKSQGSTYHTVIVDLQDISTCRSYSTFLKLLYVATTRPSHKLYLYDPS